MTPVLINECNVMDFGFDPFDPRRLAVACDDGRVRVWTIPEGGLLQQTNEPQFSFAAHADKIQASVISCNYVYMRHQFCRMCRIHNAFLAGIRKGLVRSIEN